VDLLAILGPSGSGKSTLVRELQSRGLIELTPSWTTRPRRADEGDAAIEHLFVGEDRFAEKCDDGAFLEVVELFGYRYGLPPVLAPPPGQAATVMVRAPLMDLVGKHFPEHVAYQIEDSFERAQSRLTERSLTEPELRSRLDEYEAERILGRRFAHRTFVNDSSVTDLVDRVAAAINEDFFPQ
jgi:guanylate kinase